MQMDVPFSYEAPIMSLSPYQFQLLTHSSQNICREFEHFYTHFDVLIRDKRDTFPTYSQQFNHREYVFKLIEYLTSQQSVWLFVEKNQAYLRKLLSKPQQVKTFQEEILIALATTLKSQFTTALRKAWQNILKVFTNMVLTKIHGHSNVISMKQYKLMHREKRSLNHKMLFDK